MVVATASVSLSACGNPEPTASNTDPAQAAAARQAPETYSSATELQPAHSSNAVPPASANGSADGQVDLEAADDVMALVWAEEKAGIALDMSGLRTDFPEVWAETVTEHDKRQLVVQYDHTADPAKLAAFLEILTALENDRWTYRLAGETVDRDSYRIVGRAVDFNYEDLYQRSQAMVQEREAWSSRLGLGDVVFSHPDILTGEVVVYTSQVQVHQVGSRFGFPIRIESSAGELEVQM